MPYGSTGLNGRFTNKRERQYYPNRKSKLEAKCFDTNSVLWNQPVLVNQCKNNELIYLTNAIIPCFSEGCIHLKL